jgi:hypothetical protein
MGQDPIEQRRTDGGAARAQREGTMAYLKHEEAAAPLDLGGIEVELGTLAHAVKGYAIGARGGNNTLALFTDPDGYPVRLDLVGEQMERIATALECLAVARGAKLPAKSMKRRKPVRAVKRQRR